LNEINGSPDLRPGANSGMTNDLLDTPASVRDLLK
jgi:hypothetical protein